MAYSNSKGKKRYSKGYKKSNPKDNRNSRDYDSKSKPDDEDINPHGSNDPSWYANSTQLLKDAASLSYSWPAGARVHFDNPYTAAYGDESMPGIISYLITPTVGISADNSSAVNLAARNIYSFVRHANSGHSNYDSPDLMLYLLAMDSIYSMYNWMARIYGVCRLYSQKNRYYPAALISAMGVDYDDIMLHLADFRYYINTVGIKMGAFCTPSSMSYFARHAWMFSNVYTDGISLKSQIYLFTPSYLYKYNETSGSGKLDPVEITSSETPLTFEGIRKICDGMLAKIVESEDLNIMSGDILKAFGDSGVYKVGQVAEDYIVSPMYNQEVLSQMHNITINADFTGTHAIEQNPTTGAILFQPAFMAGCYGYLGDRMISIDQDEVEPAMTMVATRLTTIAATENSDPTSGQTRYTLDSAGSDICTGAYIYWYGLSTDTSDWVLKTDNFPGVMKFTHSSSFEFIHRLAMLEKFNHHAPVQLMDAMNPEATQLLFAGTFMDVDNFTLVNVDDLKKMHETALLSMFDVPSMGAFSRKTV